MFGWGITLMVVGGLSFILPMMGRQFLIVTALGLTGAGSSVVGIGLFIVGFMLFNAGRKRMADGTVAMPPLQSQTSATSQSEALRTFKEAAAQPESDVRIITEKAFSHADAGDAEAQLLVGMAYLGGANGLPQDPKKAAHYLLQAAVQGQGLAAYVIAGMYSEGVAFPLDFDKARMWALKAKTLGADNADQMLAAIDARRST